MTDHLQQLLQRKRLLEKRLAQIAANKGQPCTRNVEAQALERENDEVLDSLGNCSLEEFLKVRKAIQRYESGSYGICVNCGETIVEQRLDSLPETDVCTSCAEEELLEPPVQTKSAL